MDSQASTTNPVAAGIKPALGLTWADMVTTRLMLTRPEGVDANEEFQKVRDTFAMSAILLATLVCPTIFS